MSVGGAVDICMSLTADVNPASPANSSAKSGRLAWAVGVPIAVLVGDPGGSRVAGGL